MKSMIVLCTACALLAAASRSNPHYNPAKSHHTESGFRNNYPHQEKQSFWKWMWARWTGGVPEDPAGGYGFPVLKPDVAFLAANRSEPTLTWIGHATLLLQVGGVNVLTDPHFTERASPVAFAGPKRHVPPALALAELPHIDAVVISHNHYDHLDAGTVRHLNRQAGGAPRFFVPLGQKAWFAAEGIDNVVELDWWDHVQHMGLEFHLVPVQHWSARTPWDRNQTLWGGWMVEHPSLRFFFAGDTGYSKDFADIRGRFGPIDLAAIPVGCYEPRWFMRANHVEPDESVQIHRDLGARYSVGIHWGTFRLTDERLDEPPQRLASALASAGIPPERFFLMQHGELRRLEAQGLWSQHARR
jgi:N-acyl-phosphatidylethanolamine-hydrolysing phospholipase D